MFHAHSDWFFTRLPDGAVRVQRGTPPETGSSGAPMTVDIDPHTWASAVASVSAVGETAETHRAALALHQQPAEVDPVVRAKAAYSCYGDVAGWKNFRGDPMPRWEDLGEKIQNCWIAASAAAASHRPAEPDDGGAELT